MPGVYIERYNYIAPLYIDSATTKIFGYKETQNAVRIWSVLSKTKHIGMVFQTEHIYVHWSTTLFVYYMRLYSQMLAAPNVGSLMTRSHDGHFRYEVIIEWPCI